MYDSGWGTMTEYCSYMTLGVFWGGGLEAPEKAGTQWDGVPGGARPWRLVWRGERERERESGQRLPAIAAGKINKAEGVSCECSLRNRLPAPCQIHIVHNNTAAILTQSPPPTTNTHSEIAIS